MLHIVNTVLEIGPTKQELFFFKREENTQLHRAKQVAEQLFTREIFLFITSWDW